LQFLVHVKTQQKLQKCCGPLKFVGHIVHQWYNNIYKNQMFCSFNIYTRDILYCAICCCVLGRLPAANTHSVEAGILCDVPLQYMVKTRAFLSDGSNKNNQKYPRTRFTLLSFKIYFFQLKKYSSLAPTLSPRNRGPSIFRQTSSGPDPPDR
jgi:hypothetical protein